VPSDSIIGVAMYNKSGYVRTINPSAVPHSYSHSPRVPEAEAPRVALSRCGRQEPMVHMRDYRDKSTTRSELFSVALALAWTGGPELEEEHSFHLGAG
jgi:hypothetical protein